MYPTFSLCSSSFFSFRLSSCSARHSFSNLSILPFCTEISLSFWVRLDWKKISNSKETQKTKSECWSFKNANCTCPVVPVKMAISYAANRQSHWFVYGFRGSGKIIAFAKLMLFPLDWNFRMNTPGILLPTTDHTPFFSWKGTFVEGFLHQEILRKIKTRVDLYWYAIDNFRKSICDVFMLKI